MELEETDRIRRNSVPQSVALYGSDGPEAASPQHNEPNDAILPTPKHSPLKDAENDKLKSDEPSKDLPKVSPSTTTDLSTAQKSPDASPFFSIVQFKKRLSCFFAPLSLLLHHSYITPTSRVALFLDIVSLCYFLYNITTVPYRAAFESDSNTIFLITDITFDVVFFLFMCSNFFLAHQAPTAEYKLIRSRLYAFMYYVKRTFWLDLVIILPFDWLSEDPKWRLTRLLGLVRFEMLYSNIEKRFRHQFPMALKFMKLFAYLLVSIHFGACFWYLASNAAGTGRTRGTYISEDPLSVSTLREILMSREVNPSYTWSNLRHYIVSMCFSAFYMMGYQSMLPQNLIQTFYGIFTAIVGAGFFATLISTASALVEDGNRTQAQFDNRMMELRDYMRFKKITPKLRTDIELYYMYLYRSKRLTQRKDIIPDIDPSLDREIALCLHRELVEKVPLFKAIGNSLFIEDICTLLNYTLLLKGYYIIRKGEVGRDMYFIKSGTVEVTNEEGDVVYASLGEGSFFGEVALTSESTIRTASIRAAENCELYYLTKSDFQEVLAMYPDALAVFKDITEARMQETANKEKELEEKRRREQEEQARLEELKKQRIAREMELESTSSDENSDDNDESLSTTTTDISSTDDDDGDEKGDSVQREEEIARALSSGAPASTYVPSARIANIRLTSQNIVTVLSRIPGDDERPQNSTPRTPPPIISRGETSVGTATFFNRFLSPQTPPATPGSSGRPQNSTPPTPPSTLPPRRRITPIRRSGIQFSPQTQALLNAPGGDASHITTDHRSPVLAFPSPGDHLAPISPLSPLVSRPLLGYNNNGSRDQRSPMPPVRTQRRIPDLLSGHRDGLRRGARRLDSTESGDEQEQQEEDKRTS